MSGDASSLADAHAIFALPQSSPRSAVLRSTWMLDAGTVQNRLDLGSLREERTTMGYPLLELKKVLSARETWLSPFLIPIEQKIRERLDPFRNEQPHYEPLHVEPLINDVSDLLNKCLSFRQQANELDAMATKQALDYKLFSETADLDRQLSILGLMEAQHEKIAEAHGNAAVALDGDVLEGLAPIARGMRAQSIGAKQIGEVSREQEQQKRPLLESRWAKLHDYQNALRSRHEEPGNGLNYAERYSRVIDLMLEDLEEAYRKAISVAAGMQLLFAFNDPIPDYEVDGFLDAFIKWTRRAIRFLEDVQQDEVEFDISVPLTQPWRKRGNAEERMLTADAFSNAVKETEKGWLSINTTDVFPDTFEFLRVRRLALSYSANDANADYKNYRFSALIFPPEQPRPLGPKRATKPRRPPLVISDIGILNADATPNFHGGLGLLNVNPRGEWRIRLLPMVTNAKNAARYRWEANAIHDLKLHLQVVCRPKSDPIAWETWG